MPRCPSCVAERPRRIGSLPHVTVFAGRDAAGVLPESSLYRCLACGLMFRHPVLTAAEYDALYDKTQSACWLEGPGRMDWLLVEDYLRRNAPAGASVLDFGCHTGGLLKRLGPDYARTGVEVNETIARVARQQSGAEVVTNLESLPPGSRFDFAIAVDVVEHFADPGRAVASLLEVIRPGGTLVVTTGDADNYLWRVAGARWWYCCYPEHLAFISERWIRDWLRRTGNGAHLAEARRFRHLHLSPLRCLVQTCLFLSYLAGPRAYVWLETRLRRMLGRNANACPPGNGLTKDHVLLAIRKPA